MSMTPHVDDEVDSVISLRLEVEYGVRVAWSPASEVHAASSPVLILVQDFDVADAIVDGGSRRWDTHIEAQLAQETATNGCVVRIEKSVGH